MITESVLDIIGNTPMVSLKKLTGLDIYAKAEFLNPGGSIKDRVAKYMIEQAEARGSLKPGMTIMEPTSGNTGIGIALVGVQKGYKVIIVMPENMSEERKKIIRALGAELVLTKAEDSIGGSVAEVQKRKSADPAIFIPQQFENPDNPEIPYHSPGDLGTDGRQGGCVRFGARERRNTGRRRQIYKGKESGSQNHRGRTQECIGTAWP